MNNNLTNDLLLQILEKQQEDSQVLHELKGNIDVRVKKLEDAQSYNWWATYVVTPSLMVLHGIARSMGAKF
jgi:hypothetical protein